MRFARGSNIDMRCTAHATLGAVLRYFWELFTYNVKVVATGIDVYVLFRKNLREPVKGLLKLCATHSEEINKLLRIIVPTAWP